MNEGGIRHRGSFVLTIAVAVGAAVLLAVLLVPGGSARGAGAKSRILFDRFVALPLDYNVMSMKADGSGEKTLTQDPADEWGPSMSPNGKKIVFVAQRDADGNNEIATINADGSNFRQLTNTPAGVYNEYPTYSANGKKIIFDSDVDGDQDVWVMDANGDNQRNLTNNKTASDCCAAASSMGRKIVFESDRDGDYEIYTTSQGGRNVHQVTRNDVTDGEPAWFPSGKRVVFERDYPRNRRDRHDEPEGEAPAPADPQRRQRLRSLRLAERQEDRLGLSA